MTKSLYTKQVESLNKESYLLQVTLARSSALRWIGPEGANFISIKYTPLPLVETFGPQKSFFLYAFFKTRSEHERIDRIL